MSKNGNGDLSFVSKLWQAADKMRNNMDAAEYKHVILGLIFLKYISDIFTEIFNELQNDKKNHSDPEDIDEYKMRNVFWVPPEARWSYLQKNAKQPTIGKLIREAIGKAWPLFLFLAFNMKKVNKFITNYAELKEKLNVSPNTLKDWRDHLVQNNVVQVFKGNGSMSFVLLSPYDSLVTCEQDDWAAIRIKTDAKVKRVLDKLSSHDNMSLLPLIVELSAKVNKLEKKAESL